MVARSQAPVVAADRLLSFLREDLQTPSIGYAEKPVHIPGGSGVRVYGFRLDTKPFDAPMVVRILPVSHHADDRASLESCVQNTLADLGYPVPRVVAACDDPTILEGAFEVMQWVSGEPLLRTGNNARATQHDSSFLSQVLPDLGRLLLRNWPRDLAALHARLHELEVGALETALLKQGINPARLGVAAEIERTSVEIEEHGLVGLRPGADWLFHHAPDDTARRVICHGDFFANQVFGERGRYTVLDWSDVLLAPAEIDVGTVECGIVTAPVDLPGPLEGLGSATQRWLARRFVAAYEALRPCDLDYRRFGQVLKGVRILSAMGARRCALSGTTPNSVAANPFDSPLGERRVIEYIDAAAGVRLRL